MLAPADHAERGWHALLPRERLHAIYEAGLLLGFAQVLLARDLKHAAVKVAHHAHQLLDFLPGCEAAGDRLPLRRVMRRRSRSTQANRTRANRIAQFPLHPFQIAGSRLISESPLSHDERAQRRMPDITRVVYSLGKPVNRIEVFGKGFP